MQTNPFLIDTSAWIFALRPDGSKSITARVDFLLQHDEVFTTGIIMLELLGGTRNELEYERLKKHLGILSIVQTNELLWEAAFDLAFFLRRKGQTIPYTDILIAAAAMENQCIILHADRHFDHISKYTDLRVESCLKLVGVNPSRGKM